MHGYNSHGLSAHWEHKQGSRKSNDSWEWKGLELGKRTRWHDLPPKDKTSSWNNQVQGGEGPCVSVRADTSLQEVLSRRANQTQSDIGTNH